METSENNQLNSEPESGNTMAVSSSATIANESNSIANTHSTGISFENSIAQQQHHFEIGLAKLAKANSELLSKRIRVRGNRFALRNNLTGFPSRI